MVNFHLPTMSMCRSVKYRFCTTEKLVTVYLTLPFAKMHFLSQVTKTFKPIQNCNQSAIFCTQNYSVWRLLQPLFSVYCLPQLSWK